MYSQKTTANNTLKVNTANWAGGMYFVEITQGKNRKLVKVVKL